jgi:hypothetical protein
MEIEWTIHTLNSDIDHCMDAIQREVSYLGSCHYHSSGTYICPIEGQDQGPCAGPSPYWMLKHALESALKALNDKYPTTPLNEIK